MSAALYHGLCPDHERPRVVANLVQEVAKQRHQMDCGVLGAKYLLNVLVDNGHAEDAYRLVTQKEYPGYGWQIEQGASTLWENWDGGDSQLHIMFGDVSAWFYKALAGIRLDISKPRCFVIRPHPVGGVTWAKASSMTVSGRIESEWSRRGDELTMQIRIPANATGLIYVPGADGYALHEVGSGGRFRESAAEGATSRPANTAPLAISRSGATRHPHRRTVSCNWKL